MMYTVPESTNVSGQGTSQQHTMDIYAANHTHHIGIHIIRLHMYIQQPVYTLPLPRI